VVTSAREEALAHAAGCLVRSSVPGGERPALVAEEYLDGPQVSLFCGCDGTDAVALAPAQDCNALADGHTGPHTRCKGAYCPLPWAPEDLVEQVMERVARPVVREMARRGTPYTGVLYVGLALTSRGLRVVEFNARFGDPETQVVLARLASSPAQLLHAAATGTLADVPPPRWRDESAVTVVVASEGYPGVCRLGDVIEGVAAAEELPGVHVLHAGCATAEDGSLVSAGG